MLIKKNIQNNCIFKFNNNIKQFYIFFYFFLTFKKKIYPLQCCTDTSIYSTNCNLLFAPEYKKGDDI